MRKIIRCLLVTMFLVPAFQTVSFADTNPAEDMCSELQGAAYGLCNAYCEAMDCDGDEPQASERACERVLANFEKKTGDEMPPCIAVACPCFDSSDIEGQGIDFDAVALIRSFCQDNSPNNVSIEGFRPIDGEFWRVLASSGLSDMCSFDDDANGISIVFSDITQEEVEACRDIILNSQMWALNCGD